MSERWAWPRGEPGAGIDRSGLDEDDELDGEDWDDDDDWGEEEEEDWEEEEEEEGWEDEEEEDDDDDWSSWDADD